MCGVVGIVSSAAVNTELYDALTVLQHRGQDAAGIMTVHNGQFRQRKGVGLVRSVFSSSDMQNLLGNAGVGHCRYPTAGSSGPSMAQPFYVNSPFGICLSHNGNLVNSDSLVREMFEMDRRHLNTDSDSEVLLNVFAHELQLTPARRLTANDIFAAVTKLHRRCSGAYACVALIGDHGLIAFRDPNGIRPLVLGQRNVGGKTAYMVASESAALSVLDYQLVRDVEPGECIYITYDGELVSRQCADRPQHRPCIFEHVYLARPDSRMDGINVYRTRLRQGEKLAEKIRRERPDHDIDVVIPIPDTSRVSAQALAETLGLKLREGLMKNRYIGRTFIMPGQAVRKKSVRQKLNVIEPEFKGRNVLLVDDSIVRGTTCKQIIEMARSAGANKVFFASAAPPVCYPNVYGIDMPAREELIAYNKSVDQIAKEIGVDWLVYQDVEDMIEASKMENPNIDTFECSVFTGEYVTGDVDADYLASLEQKRNDGAQNKASSSAQTESIGVYNQSATSV